ncbi:MAG: EthD family reductase [Chloroflexi bacterium]|nr:EthD family reductase [Chloroflexota bacterium]
MHRMLVLYRWPADPEQFKDYFEAIHVPLTQKLPGLRRFVWSFDVRAPIRPDSPYFCVAELEFVDEAATLAALESPQGAAVAADIQNYATAGVTLLHYSLPG